MACVRVLCVEDEAVLRRTLLRLLVALGYETVGVDSAEAALGLVHEDPTAIDLVISDLRLPKMRGDVLCRELEARHPGLRGRTVLMSGLDRGPHREGNFLQKPFSAAQLQSALELALRSASGNEAGKA